MNKNVTNADRPSSRERAKELADRCIAEAAVLEISLDDMEPELGSIEKINYEAMVHLDTPGTPGD